MSRSVRSTSTSPHNRRSISTPSNSRGQQGVPQSQSNMTDGIDGWFVPDGLPDRVDGLDGPSERAFGNPRQRGSHGGSSNRRGQGQNSPQESEQYNSRSPTEFRQWSEQSRSQIMQRSIPYVVHDNRTYIGNDWKCTNGNAPRISQTISSYYMGAPVQQTPMLYRNETQEYRGYPNMHTRSDVRPPNHDLPDFQPSHHGRRVSPPEPSEENNPPPYQQRQGSDPISSQTRVHPAPHQGICENHESLILGELEAVSPLQTQITRNHHRDANKKRSSGMSAGREDASTRDISVMPNPFIVCNEPTSREHFNMLLSRLRSFSETTGQENAFQLPYSSSASRVNRGAQISAPQIEVNPSGKQLFEKAKREDKTGIYENCYWDDKMDCFVNKGAGDIGPFWK